MNFVEEDPAKLAELVDSHAPPPEVPLGQRSMREVEEARRGGGFLRSSFISPPSPRGQTPPPPSVACLIPRHR